MDSALPLGLEARSDRRLRAELRTGDVVRAFSDGGGVGVDPHPVGPLSEAVEELFDMMLGFCEGEPRDDATVLAIRWKGRG